MKVVDSASDRIWSRDFGLMWICRLCMFSAVHLLVPVFPLYLAGLGLGSSGIGLVSSLFFLTATLVRPFTGYVADVHGARTSLLLFMVPFIVAPFGYALTTSVVLLSLFRIFQGAGFSASSAGAALTSNLLPAARRGQGLGTYNIASNVAAALSASLGVWLFHQRGADALFVLSGLVALLAMVAGVLVREPAVERQGPAPNLALYLRRYLSRDTLALSIPLATVTFATGGVYAFLPLQAVAAGFTNPGFYFALYAVGLVVVRPLSGGLSDRFDRRLLVLPAFAPLVMAMALLAWLPGTWAFYVAAVLHALGHGTLEAVMIATLVDRMPPDRRGAALSQWSLFYDLGLAAGGSTLGMVLTWTQQSYGWMYLVTIGVALAGMAVYGVMNPPPDRGSTRLADAAGEP